MDTKSTCQVPANTRGGMGIVQAGTVQHASYNDPREYNGVHEGQIQVYAIVSEAAVSNTRSDMSLTAGSQTTSVRAAVPEMGPTQIQVSCSPEGKRDGGSPKFSL